MTDGILMVELPDLPPDSTKLAEQMFAGLGLPKSYMLSMPFKGGTCRYFLVLAAPRRVDGCTFLTCDDVVVAMVHGTDCNMVRRIHKDVRYGKQSDFQYCERRLAGGAFETIDWAQLAAEEFQLLFGSSDEEVDP